MSAVVPAVRRRIVGRVLRLVGIHAIRCLLTVDLTMTGFVAAAQLLHPSAAWPLDPGPGVLLLALAGAQWLRRQPTRPDPRGGAR